MTLIETERAVELYRALGSAVEMSGGSAANTMCGVASFGGRAAYVGKVSDDELGRVFGHDLLAVGVAFRPGSMSDGVPTGRCIIVVTPDAQRTMNTFLGASSTDERARRRHRDRRRRQGAVHGGLPLRPRRRQGRVPPRRAGRPPSRSARVAHAVRLVLRRPSPRRLLVARPRRGRSAVRQRRRAALALPDRQLRRRRRRRPRATAGWRRSRSAPRVRTSSRPTTCCTSTPTRCAG